MKILFLNMQNVQFWKKRQITLKSKNKHSFWAITASLTYCMRSPLSRLGSHDFAVVRVHENVLFAYFF